MNDREISISVIVPVYNAAAYLEECVDSLVKQIYKPAEIILVDDGSTDKSPEMCDSFSQRYSYIKTIHTKNGGVSSARNIGIEAAQGEYLIFVDSDDKVHQELLSQYKTYFSPDCVVMCCSQTDMDTTGNAPVEEYTIQEFMEMFSKGYINVPWNKMYSSEILRKNQIRFPEKMNLGEDIVFNLLYFEQAPERYRIIKAPLYWYRENVDNSLSNCFHENLFDIQLCIFQNLNEFLETMGVDDRRNKAIYLRLFWNRMYMTLNIYRSQLKKENNYEVKKKFYDILQNPFWEILWEECRKEKVITLKMLMKKFHVACLRLHRGYCI
ncbi:hypothetical protein B5F29_01245 [Lachnoclostridium sp. An196]|uniref:glycosyltransferase family 2 protein n=1 Tax=Lachnoclostridium sp. An196 TaxID=1965583 RepID=UPI000B387DA2|nr:glycosyltransferase family A protein [Lachnoclostridium sp. An196]OUP22395.1 hypothetical protein B5F29_01245 [Lachnoclostridium sp. An196]